MISRAPVGSTVYGDSHILTSCIPLFIGLGVSVWKVDLWNSFG